MPACVSETSYYLIFVVALIIGVALIAGSAYSYDRFKNFREKPDEADNDKLHTATNVSILFLVLGLLGIMTLFILFFGFQKRLVGVYTTTNVPHTAQVMSHTPSAPPLHK